MALPIFQDNNKNLMLLQTGWSSQLNPLLSQPLNSGTILKNINLVIGTNNINHKLSRNLQGWIIVRKRGLAGIYDTQDSNVTPNLTLQLVSDAEVSVDILVF